MNQKTTNNQRRNTTAPHTFGKFPRTVRCALEGHVHGSDVEVVGGKDETRPSGDAVDDGIGGFSSGYPKKCDIARQCDGGCQVVHEACADTDDRVLGGTCQCINQAAGGRDCGGACWVLCDCEWRDWQVLRVRNASREGGNDDDNGKHCW